MPGFMLEWLANISERAQALFLFASHRRQLAAERAEAHKCVLQIPLENIHSRRSRFVDDVAGHLGVSCKVVQFVGGTIFSRRQETIEQRCGHRRGGPGGWWRGGGSPSRG